MLLRNHAIYNILNRTLVDFQIGKIWYVCEGNVIFSKDINLIRDKNVEIWLKKSSKMGQKWAVSETEIRSTIGLKIVTSSVERARPISWSSKAMRVHYTVLCITFW